MSRLLTDAERERFATYLEQDADSSDLLVKQLESLPHGVAIAKNMRTEAMAARIVARKLRSAASMTLAAPTEPPHA